MLKTQDFDIVGSYNNQRNSTVDAERSINLFEYRDPLGKKPKSLFYTSGLIDEEKEFTGQTKGVRAQYVLLGFMYLIVGKGVYRIDSNNVLTLLGTLLNTDSGYAAIDANSFQIIFVDGVDGYIWDTTTEVFTQITDTNFPKNPLDVCTLDNFFVVIEGGTNNLQLSMYDQGLVWGTNTQTFTDNTANNWLILASTDNYQTGVPFTVTTTGTLPPPLLVGTTYYAIHVDATHIRVAATFADAQANIPIVLLAGSAPTNTIVASGQFQQGKVETHPGTLVACRTLHRRLFLFTQYFTEVWENAGIGTNLPFRRNNSLLMEYGCAAIGSVAVGFDVMIFLSADRDGLGAVMMVEGTQSIPVSTRALDFALARDAAILEISDCRAFFVKENGLIFYRLNFTQANHTYVYNVTQSIPDNDATKFWHEEEVLNGDRHPAQTHGYFNGINYVGHYLLPILYRLSVNAYTNAGETIKRTRITRSFAPPGYQRIRVDRLQLDLLQGQEVPNTPEALEIFLSISKDGSQTYGYANSAPLGAVGERSFRTVFRKLGTIPRGQPWVVKIEFYEHYPLIILGASWAVAKLPE